MELCLRTYRQQTESILFQDELPGLLLEYAQNQLFVAEYANMYLVHDWTKVIFISDPNPANSFKCFAFPIPFFDQETYPFIIVCGQASLSLLNIKTREHKPLINQKMCRGLPGV